MSWAWRCLKSPLAYLKKSAAAIYWYQKSEISQEKAAQIAGLNRKDFLMALAREQVDVFVVDFDDLQRELERG